MELSIENGRIFIQKKFVEMNVGILDGKIAQISRTKIKAEESIHARGLLVLPGFIDPHVHLREPGAKYKEDFYTGTCAAANGGYTTVLDMPNSPVPTDSVQKLKDKIKLTEKKAVVDFSLYFGATENNLLEIDGLNYRIPVKFYMDRSQNLFVPAEKLPECFKKLAEKDLLACVHAEDAEIIATLMEKYKENETPAHGSMRPVEAEIKAVADALAASAQAKSRLHICHVSSKAALLEIKKGTAENCTCEVAPHHLFLTEKDYAGALLKVNPPLRSSADAAALWDGLIKGDVDCIASDHAPHTIEEKERNYWSAPSGVPELDTTLKLMLTKVNQRVISLERLVEACSINPAKIFGLENKGTIAIGKDADLTLIDLKKEGIIKSDELKTKCAWSPYEGFAYRGCAAKAIVRGQLVMDGGEILGKRGCGKFLGEKIGQEREKDGSE